MRSSDFVIFSVGTASTRRTVWHNGRSDKQQRPQPEATEANNLPERAGPPPVSANDHRSLYYLPDHFGRRLARGSPQTVETSSWRIRVILPLLLTIERQFT